MAEADELTVNTIAARASLVAKRKSLARTANHEAMRDLIRLRSVVRQIVSRARQHLQGFLLRPIRDPDGRQLAGSVKTR
jgi:hypothetical protein